MNNEQLDTDTGTAEQADTGTETIDVDYASMTDDEFITYINKEEKELNSNVEKEELDNSVENEEVVEKETETEEDSLPTFENEKELYDKVLTDGFKARGKMIKPKNLQDLISLAQKGVDYNVKNREINNYRKQIETLNSAGITSIEDLNLAMDLFKGDKEAIKKILADKQIDVYSLGDDVTYKPHSGYTPSDSSLQFRAMVDDVKDREYFKDLQEVALSKWDSASRQELLSNMKLFKGLIDEFEMGRFQMIQEQVEHERMFGRLEGLNDLQAYVKIVSDYENKQKQKNQKQVTSRDIDVNKEAITQVKRVDNTKSMKRVYSDVELARLSDEEYMKLYNAGELD